MEDLPEIRFTTTEAFNATLEEMQQELGAFGAHEHILVGLMKAKEGSDEI